MEPDVTTGILAGGARFAPKVRRPGDVLDGEIGCVEHFVAVEICHGHLGGRYQEEIALLDAKGVLLELRKLAGAGHRSSIDQLRRQDLRIRVLANGQVDQKVDQRARERCSSTLQENETRAGDLDRTLEIDDAEP